MFKIVIMDDLIEGLVDGIMDGWTDGWKHVKSSIMNILKTKNPRSFNLEDVQNVKGIRNQCLHGSKQTSRVKCRNV